MVTCLLLFSVVLTGCADSTIHTTIQRDGSADLAISLLLDQGLLLLGQATVQTQLESYLHQRGFILEWSTTDQATTLVARRHVAHAADLLELLPPTPATTGLATPLTVTHSLCFDYYQLNCGLDFSSWLGAYCQGWQFSLALAALAGTELTMKVTLPWRAKEHNADFVEDQGHTLGWQVHFAEPRMLQFVVCAPGRRCWLMVGGTILLIAIVGASFGIKRQLTRRK